MRLKAFCTFQAQLRYCLVAVWSMALWVAAPQTLGAEDPSSGFHPNLIVPVPSQPGGPDGLELPAELQLPSGTGPFPAVIILHGCGGVHSPLMPHLDGWRKMLRTEGYATLLIDSFGPRYYRNVCASRSPDGRDRSPDVYAAAMVLSTLPTVIHDRISVIGFSHGAWGALWADIATNALSKQLREHFVKAGRIASFVALYPNCRDTDTVRDFISPLLILIGEKDDWTPAAACKSLLATNRPENPHLELVVYPEAYHAYDDERNGAGRHFLGHKLRYDAEASRDTAERVMKFLSATTRATAKLIRPEDGEISTDFSPQFNWLLPPDAAQVHFQMAPTTTDGPGVDVILDASANFRLSAPRREIGPFVLLPGENYVWRIRTTSLTGAVGPNDPVWGAWVARSLSTVVASANTINAGWPLDGSTVETLQPTLEWKDSNEAVFYYDVQVSDSATFSREKLHFEALVHGGLSRPINSVSIPESSSLDSGRTYYWRVRPHMPTDDSAAWGSAFSFRTP